MKLDAGTEIRDEARQLRTALRRKCYQAWQKRQRLYRVVCAEYQDLKKSVENYTISDRLPEFRILVEYLRANILLVVQMEQWMCRTSSCASKPLPQVPSVSSTIDLWEEYLCELEDRMDEAKRTKDREYMAILTELLQVVDTVERLQALPVEKENRNVENTQEFNHCLQMTVEKIHKQLLSALRRRGVKRIQLAPGDYPPVETTRIVSRIDNSQSDSFVIDRIVEQGYSYKHQVLRKTVVIVRSSIQEE